MNIIIPLGGKGERFYKEGYLSPKPLIKIFNKEMILHVIDNLNVSDKDGIFIIYNIDFDKFNFSEIITKKYPQISLIPINYQTSGAVETLNIGLAEILRQQSQSLTSTSVVRNKCVLLDCDTFYTQDILTMVRESETNMVFYTKKTSELPIYSYIELDCNNKIITIKEKQRISCNANTGCYVFNNILELQTNCKYVLDNKITFNGEPYTSCVIAEMIKHSDFYGYELEPTRVFSLGTPLEVEKFVKNSHIFLFDLDGTLVKTDDIYVSVWKQILSEYKIDLTQDIFNKYIHGNSDSSVVNALIPNATHECIKRISELKDELFIQNLHRLLIIDGMIEFMKLIKTNGHQSCIVTNSNRLVAEKIVDYCNLNKLIDTIIIGSECARSKPYPDPYLCAIKYYNSTPKKAIIFEDSKSGLLSATQTTPFCVVGITTNYSEDELIKNGANIVINNYWDLDLTKILLYDNLSIEHIKRHVVNSINSLNINVREIKMEETKLKGGYISDVLALQIITVDGVVLDCVLKLENTHETKLSIMAKKLGLYERENYFYENVSKYVNIMVPKFYGLIKDDNFNTIGILMENLNSKGNYSLNVNLNSNNIDISLQVIANLAKFHNKFWNKDITKIFPELKKHNDKLFNPTWAQFVMENWSTFKENWKNLLSVKQLTLAENIVNTFHEIQGRLSRSNLTIIHGDVKSPNIFYNLNNNYEPVFLDWQYIAIGKGAQDMIFFLIESFDLENIKLNYPIFKNYYYKKLMECGVTNYSYLEYENDLKDAVGYFPFFVAIWFGTTPQDDLIDKNFPFFFIQKLFYFLDELQ